MKYEFTIHAPPKGKERPRIGKGTTYTPKATKDYEKLVQDEYALQCGHRFADDVMLGMTVMAWYEIPKSTNKKNREKMLWNIIRPTKKPDIDNILKLIADALNGIAYRDDAQIVQAHIFKGYSDNPRVEVEIEVVE